MKQLRLCNIPESFTREIKYLLIYEANSLTFNENYRSLYPPNDTYLAKIVVQTTERFKRSFSLKKKNFNRFFSINISFEFYDLSFENRKNLEVLSEDKKYLIVAVSNKEMIVLGNKREPLTIDVFDKISDNGKGKDNFLISIKGETLIFPMIRKVTEPFRVLFFSHPFP